MTLSKCLQQWHDAIPARIRRMLVYPLLGSLAVLSFTLVTISTTILAGRLGGALISIPVAIFWVVLGGWLLIAVVIELDDF